jgi:hypothetical protein
MEIHIPDFGDSAIAWKARRFVMRSRSTLMFGLLSCGFGSTALGGDDLRINQLQVIGTHNSYHIAPHTNVQGMLGAKGRDVAKALDYTHRPLAEQFSVLGIRQIELDVFADPDGGRYAHPAARMILKGMKQDPGPDPNEGGKLEPPGFKVFHIQDIDYLTTATTFKDALQQVHKWSSEHRDHVPILVLVELKDEAIAALPTKPAPFGKKELDGIDAEIRSVFAPGEFFSPDDLRGSHETLPEAIKTQGWPTLQAARGQVIFALDNEGSIQDLYLTDHPALRGRAMFVSVPSDHPAAAWMKINDPVAEFDHIRELVKAGFLVRTRADADTVEGRKNDPSRREKALASGAQFISTDFPEPRPELSVYQVRLPENRRAQLNPVSGTGESSTGDLETIPNASRLDGSK